LPGRVALCQLSGRTATQPANRTSAIIINADNSLIRTLAREDLELLLS
jgi:hypothetical protein